jgi:hypothetical protein
MNDAFNFRIQCVILLIAFILFIVYYYKLFKNEEYNKLAYAYAIVSILWWLTIFVRFIITSNYNLTDTLSFKFLNSQIYVPYSLKCFFGERYCEQGNITIWALIHFLIYMFIGMYVPNQYGFIFAASVGCELIENGLGYPSKCIIDVIVNLFGYFVGSSIHKYRNSLRSHV